MNLHPLTVAEFYAFAPVIAPLIDQMAERFPDDWPKAETVRQVDLGLLRMWLVFTPPQREPVAMVGTEVGRKPSGRRFCSVTWTAGSRHKEWAADVVAILMQQAQADGCDVFSIDGRAGWGRALPSLTERRWVSLSRELRP